MQTNSDYFTNACLTKPYTYREKNALAESTVKFAAGNTYGERLKPQCFKGVKILPCLYQAQHKIWMSGELFEDWVHELDRKFTVSKRKVALIIDNCTTHPNVENLKWV